MGETRTASAEAARVRDAAIAAARDERDAAVGRARARYEAAEGTAGSAFRAALAPTEMLRERIAELEREVQAIERRAAAERDACLAPARAAYRTARQEAGRAYDRARAYACQEYERQVLDSRSDLALTDDRCERVHGVDCIAFRLRGTLADYHRMRPIDCVNVVGLVSLAWLEARGWRAAKDQDAAWCGREGERVDWWTWQEGCLATAASTPLASLLSPHSTERVPRARWQWVMDRTRDAVVDGHATSELAEEWADIERMPTEETE